ncbi:hypothetical protein TeGR_g12038 [Tetraparma gracilis]|jgi:tetratricopeptide (TPR) repeat protein|uniref:Tetratricopeptide SHNi-TPR domain-containing protein n=1 Tax=Tetraparma gracilis TaxID=2962635 RepID=A0ABQ6MDT8_9STRA|nr:hypothetical protein TeGR_g12038 [Tetraparma gracilis]
MLNDPPSPSSNSSLPSQYEQLPQTHPLYATESEASSIGSASTDPDVLSLAQQKQDLYLDIERERAELEELRKLKADLNSKKSKSKLSSHSPSLTQKTYKKMANVYLQDPSAGKPSRPSRAEQEALSEREKAQASFESSLLKTHMDVANTSSTASILSLMCKAAECEQLSEFSAAISWYNAVLAFLKASDPNEINASPIMRAHVGIADNFRRMLRLEEAEEHYESAVALAKKSDDKKGLEEAAQKLGSCLMEHSDIMEREGREQEAYLALQRGILSLQEAVDGSVAEAKNEVSLLSPGEQLMLNDRKNALTNKIQLKTKSLGVGGGGKKGGKKGEGVVSSASTSALEKPSWKPSGKSRKEKNDL